MIADQHSNTTLEEAKNPSGQATAIQPLFTIGLAQRGQIENVVQVLKDKNIQCVVDVRERQNVEGVFGQNSFKQRLREAGMIYMSFLDEFGKVAERTRKRDGSVNYEKACKDEWFTKGICRLQEGLRKGYRIALLGMEADPQESFRSLVIGRKLEELGYQTRHIKSDNQTIMQSTLMEIHRQQQIKTKMRSRQAAETGKKGEDIAARYLESCGFGILDRNWNLHKGCEIDIVAHRNGVIHFVEVKTRSQGNFVAPEWAINREKMKHIYKAAKTYVVQHQLQGIKSQIDSIAIILRKDEDYDLTFYEDINFIDYRTY